jgi:transcriptional regulator with XRE-family HTH domain
MSESIKKLIGQLLGTAHARGMSQGQLAEAAGLTPVGLSKAKGRGDLRASTLAALAQQLDLELALIPRRKEGAAAAIKAGTFFNPDPDKAGD